MKRILMALLMMLFFISGNAQSKYPPNVTQTLKERESYEIKFDTLGYLSVTGSTKRGYQWSMSFDIVKDEQIQIEDIIKAKYLSNGRYFIPMLGAEDKGLTTSFDSFLIQTDGIYFYSRSGDETLLDWKDLKDKLQSKLRLANLIKE